MSTEPDELSQSGAERVVVWQLLRGAAPEHRDAVEAWLARALTRIEVAGGALLSAVGGSLVASFDSVELEDAVDLCASLCADARSATPRLDLCCGIALGEVRGERGHGPIVIRFTGHCIDVAHALAQRGDASAVVLDEAAHERAAEQFLFRGTVIGVGTGGHVLDAAHPRRRDCRAALSALQAPIIPAGAQPAFEDLQRYLTAPGPQRVIVESDSRHQVLEWLDRLDGALSPSVRLRLRQQAGGLQPLGGLQAAVRGCFDDDAAIDAAGLPDPCAAHVRALLAGEPVSRQQAVGLLAALLAPRRGRRAWLMLDRVHDVDAASLGVVAEVLGRSELDFVAVLEIAPGAKVPAALTAGGTVHHCALGPLRAADACALAAAILGLPSDSPIARRVAVIGGPTMLGVLEAARTLVVSGDLVLGEAGFRWRTEARTGGAAVPVDALFSERVHGLEHDAHRLLEVLSLSPGSASLSLVKRVSVADGLSEQAFAGALSVLQQEGLADARGGLGPAEAAVQSAMRNAMPPARAAELHRFIARALPIDAGRPFGAALLSHHLSEGGLDRDAAEALLGAAQATSDAGFNRMAVRMAAVAVQFDASEATRKRAHRLAGRLSPGEADGDAAPSGEHAPAQDVPEGEAGNVAERAIRQAVASMCGGDHETVERWLDTAVVAGWDPTATRRLRALSQLSRGDQSGAAHTLQQAHSAGATPAQASREALCWSLVHLGAGEAEEAICAALSALSIARRADDRDGAGSALHLLAACYQAADRPGDAIRLRGAADA